MTQQTDINGPDWKHAWEKMRNQRMKPIQIDYDPEFRTKLAKDHSKIAGFNNYEYGKKTTETLGEILDLDFKVLEIGAGPGTLTVPLSRNVKQVVVVESSEVAVKSLTGNLDVSHIENVEVINRNWMEIDEHEIGDGFNLVVCSHFLWQMKDLEKHLAKMEELSSGYCAVVQPAGRDSMVKEMYTEITGERYMGQFDPDADHFAYLILRQWGRLVNVRNINYSIELDFDEEVRYIASFIGKFVVVDSKIMKTIEQYVSLKGLCKEEHSAVVMWWKKDNSGI
ncbi:MAG: rRNA adenine N-6-methyltransferase family protein [Methanosarcinales archaeon]|nr:rRNA adenine N-6-methyltransferase family protein [Methanosarcinales archaeon]